MSPRHAARGSTLIEVLIALLVACVGLLAMARLSAAAIGHQKSAQLRLTGLTLAQQYAEHARLNVYGFDLGQYAIALGDTPPTAPTLDPEAGDLSAAQALAQFDRAAFLRAVGNALPEGRALVASHADPTGRDLDIWLLWRDVPLDPADSLAAANAQQCPTNLSSADRNGARCMHFKVGL